MPKPRKGRPPYVPTAKERKWVRTAAAADMPAADMCARLAISITTLRKAFRVELNSALADQIVRVAGNFTRIASGSGKSAAWAADRWLTKRAPAQWGDRVVVEPSATPMRVVVEFVGEAAAPRDEQSPTRTSRLDDIRKNVQLVG
jgi:hypothetical protein